MSQTVPTQHPAVVLRSQYRQLKSLLAIALVALVSLSVTVVMLARDDEGTQTGSGVSYVNPIEPVNYGDVSSAPSVAKPDESKVAAAISARQLSQDTGRPDESRIAAAIGGHEGTQQDTGRPDESKIAAAIGARGESGPSGKTISVNPSTGYAFTH